MFTVPSVALMTDGSYSRSRLVIEAASQTVGMTY